MGKSGSSSEHVKAAVSVSAKKSKAKASIKVEEGTTTRGARQQRRSKSQKQKKKKQAASSNRSNTNNSNNNHDPSAQYLENPLAAPLVQAAKRFFEQQGKSFSIYQHGPTTGWRTVSKLPVRRYQREPPSKRWRIVIGMFQPKSHQVSVVQKKNQNNDYPAHHPSINHAMATITAICQNVGVDVYNETDGTGYLRYIAMNVERSTGKVQLTLIWNHEPYKEPLVIGKKKKNKKNKKKQNNAESDTTTSRDDTATAAEPGKAQLELLIAQLLRVTQSSTSANDNDDDNNNNEGDSNNCKTKDSPPSLPSELSSLSSLFELHSLWVHYNAAWKHSNAIFDIHTTSSDTWYHVHGPKSIPEQLLSIPGMTTFPTLYFAPNVFRQANLDAFAHIVQAIRLRIQPLQNDNSKKKSSRLRCVELYGGVGTIGLHLIDLPNIKSLICSDENPYNQECFQNGVTSLSNETLQKKATYVALNASNMVTDSRKFLKKCNILIVDPPRKGLDDAVVEALTNKDANNIQLLVYVSCGFDAFQRDYQRLTEPQAPWICDHAEGHILFPGSNAIETLAFFTRKK